MNMIRLLPYIFITVLLLTNFSSNLQAQNVLTDLPFGIIIGQTTNEEIEDKGTCISDDDEQESCQIYDMAGKFYVYSSENKVVNKVKFSAKDGNKLPRKWKELGLNFGAKNAPGTYDIDFRNIIKNNGAKYIESSRKFDENEEVLGILFSFEIEKLSYSVLIRMTKDQSDILGLYDVEVTEAY